MQLQFKLLFKIEKFSKMGSNIPSLLLLILLFSLYDTNYSSKLVKGDDDLIQKTCKSTRYFDLCISSLKSDPTSSQSDLKGLATIMVNVGISNATDTYAYLASQLLSSTSDNTMKKVLTTCAVKYYYANDSLKSSIQDLSEENYDYASMHAAAAADYPNVCRNAFRRYPGLGYPPELKVREEGLKHICAVVLGILDQLYSSYHNNLV